MNITVATRKPFSSQPRNPSVNLMQKSRSEPNCIRANATLSNIAIPKRKSTGNLRRSSTLKSLHSKTAWRPPGCYQIPDILGNAYLKPCPTIPLTLRPFEPTKQVTKRPWYPPSPHYQAPQLPPLVKPKNKFENKMRKMLPKTCVRSSDPRNRYCDFKEIGTGVNGAVVRASYRKKPNVQLAIKRCRLDPDPEYRAAILRELKIMSSGHTNLIKLREVTICRDDIWMAMDLMRCSVFAVLCQRGIPEEFAVHIACKTLKALIYLHGKGYLHRDVKCENLLLGWNGEVKLADFGLAARISRRNCERLGTTKWMAPEVIREEYYDEKVDMWSLGITVIEMMDRVPPHYQIKDEEELYDIIATEPSPTFTYSYPSMYMRGLVAWLLDEDPTVRPCAKDVLMEIDAHIKSNLLPCASSHELVRFLGHVLPQY
ncbi:kinase-like domain-containing protein [Radiomyces spectabilis]|uniref:kinase-like domain-containing protein n=1 Tax=Radiomyces spectabilis TaxID=64574 RepID=UPI00221E3B9B|nr:kinase-like domain-containing protein [Radiomyces spectabilis]KAI8379378.1 kinase-like domain-containing protein [Radiomyces spectabilis]